jgi:hypothetical protein
MISSSPWWGNIVICILLIFAVLFSLYLLIILLFHALIFVYIPIMVVLLSISKMLSVFIDIFDYFSLPRKWLCTLNRWVLDVDDFLEKIMLLKNVEV